MQNILLGKREPNRTEDNAADVMKTLSMAVLKSSAARGHSSSSASVWKYKPIELKRFSCIPCMIYVHSRCDSLLSLAKTCSHSA